MLFSFLTVTVWVDGQHKEREAFYKAETHAADSREPPAKAPRQQSNFFSEETRLERRKESGRDEDSVASSA